MVIDQTCATNITYKAPHLIKFGDQWPKVKITRGNLLGGTKPYAWGTGGLQTHSVSTIVLKESLFS